MTANMTAKIARKIAFNKVNTTYEECLANFMNSVLNAIKKEAKEGKLELCMPFDEAIDKHFKNIKSNYMCNTLKEVIKEQLSKMGFNVCYTRYSCSPNTTLTVSW